jgi:hypothetical protein
MEKIEGVRGVIGVSRVGDETVLKSALPGSASL